MTPEERAEALITWTMPDTAERRLVKKIAAAISEHGEQRAAEEREACAKLVEQTEVVVHCPADAHIVGTYDQGEETLAKAAAAIRARSTP